MPRSLWNGTIAIGLLTVPVKVHTATESKTVRFHEVHAKDGARIEHRRVCTKEDEEVPYEQVVKGYELSSGEYVVLDDEEIKAAAGDRTHVIEVEEFVDAGAIDPIFYERTYHLGAGDDGAQAYRLLHDALERTGRAALGRFTFHDRERLVAIRPLDAARKKLLALHTLRFADELVGAKQLKPDRPGKKPSDRETKMAAKLIDTLRTDFDPTDYDDEYRQAVLDMIARKAKGEEIEPPEPQEDEGDQDDLAAALEASLG